MYHICRSTGRFMGICHCDLIYRTDASKMRVLASSPALVLATLETCRLFDSYRLNGLSTGLGQFSASGRSKPLDYTAARFPPSLTAM